MYIIKKRSISSTSLKVIKLEEKLLANFLEKWGSVSYLGLPISKHIQNVSLDIDTPKALMTETQKYYNYTICKVDTQLEKEKKFDTKRNVFLNQKVA